ncbi:MAG: cyanophycinase [Burkholderiales bacterium]|nr:cyanophycinase [Burkholderiales bacterium]
MATSFYRPTPGLLAALCLSILNLISVPYAHASEVAMPPASGSLVIIGGALRGDNVAVWQTIIQQAGGKGAKIAVIPAAAANPERSGNASAANLNRYGASAFVLPLSVKYTDRHVQEVARDPQWIEAIKQSNGVYFTGGDQGRIVQALMQKDGTRTPLLEAIWALYQRGGVIAGSSAGAAIMSSTMFYDAKAVLPTLQYGVTDGKEIADGLGFIGKQVFIDQHLIIRGRFARMLPVMLKKNYQLGLGIDENTAMLITNQNEVEIIGYKGAILIDLSEAKTDAKEPRFNLSNAAISYLDRGDKFNLTSKVITPSADKLSGKVNPSLPASEEQRFYPDILANTTVADLLFHLIDSRQQQAIGLAFGSSQEPLAEQGFEFKFSKNAESAGYYSSSSGAESYTVMRIRLDIRPVKMQLPLYR